MCSDRLEPVTTVAPPLTTASRAHPADLDLVGGGGEAVLLGAALHPRLEIAVRQLDDAVAAGADEVMMVDVAAEPVAEFSCVMGERVHGAVLVEKRQRPVHGGEPDVSASSTKPIVELAGGDVVVLAGQLLDDQKPLRCLPDSVAGEECPCLLRRAHVV